MIGSYTNGKIAKLTYSTEEPIFTSFYKRGEKLLEIKAQI